MYTLQKNTVAELTCCKPVVTFYIVGVLIGYILLNGKFKLRIDHFQMAS